jgi:hypothetical protein
LLQIAINLSLIIYNFRPWNKEELFNLHHASACNVIEQIFGVLKKCFTILLRCDRGNPWVNCIIPLPIPSYTVPLQGMGMGINETHGVTEHHDKTMGFHIDQSIYI